MKIAVCVKYVPVVSRIRFDYENKVIQREGTPSEINPFDLLGINLAVDLKAAAAGNRDNGDNDGDTVVALSMGPPNAAEGLTQCYALGVDRAVLLSDRALAGSDTLATARALALALRRESPDLIICGRNSSDAETGQVGPEVAELMGLPHISNVRKLEVDRAANRITAERVTDSGYQVLQCPLPALVCVTEGAGAERYPGRDEMTAAQEMPVEQLTAADLSDNPSLFGLAGSPTWVEDIRLVEPDRLGVVIRDETPEAAAAQVAESLRERLAALRASTAADADLDAAAALPRHAATALPHYAGAALPRYTAGDRPIWVVAELTGGAARPVTLELLGKARALTPITRSEVVAIVISPGALDDNVAGQLAAAALDDGVAGQPAAAAPADSVTGQLAAAGAPDDSLAGQLAAAGAPDDSVAGQLAAAGAPDDSVAGQLAAAGADRILTLDTITLGPVCGRGVADSLSAAIAANPPYAVLFAATADGRDLASRIAARQGLGLTGDAIDLEINDAGQLAQLKPALGGNVVAPILSKTLPNLVTLRPGVLTPAMPDPGAVASIAPIPAVSSAGADVELLAEHLAEEHDALELTAAEVVVGVGMGVGADGLAVARELAASIGAPIATTRNVVHSGWLPHHIQVGISGRTIAPQVYVAVGIRGAFNHTVGIQKAGVILAINRNHRAAIFRAADYGIVGDWNEYLPPLVTAIKPILADYGLA